MKYNGDSFVIIFHEILILHGIDFFLCPAFKYFFIDIMKNITLYNNTLYLKKQIIIEVSFALTWFFLIH